MNYAADPLYKELTENELDFLMCHLMRVPDVIRPALNMLPVDLFDQFTERHYKLLWAISIDYFVKYNQPITHLLAINEALARTVNPLEFPPRVKQMVADKLSLYFEGWANEPPFVGYTMNLLSSFLYHRKGMRRLREAVNDPMTSPSMIQEIMQDMRNVEVVRSEMIQPFAGDMDGLFALTPRIPTGISFLDAMLGGGMRPKELYGFIAPSGGGKTTFSNQLAIECSYRFNKVFIFSYEQPIDNDYLHPVFACASQIPKARLSTYKCFADFSPEDAKAMLKARDDIKTNLHFFDFSGAGAVPAGNRGAAELEAKLVELAGQGIRPGGIIIDWFWHAVIRSANALGVKSNDLRNYAQGMIADFKQIAGRHNCWIWINQQTASAEANRKKVGDWNSAAELKSFANNMDFCWNLSALDNQQIATIKSSKARANRVQECIIQLDGDKATFRSCSEHFVMDERTKRYVNKADQSAIPSDKPGHSSTPSATAQNYAGQEEIKI